MSDDFELIHSFFGFLTRYDLIALDKNRLHALRSSSLLCSPANRHRLFAAFDWSRCNNDKSKDAHNLNESQRPRLLRFVRSKKQEDERAEDAEEVAGGVTRAGRHRHRQFRRALPRVRDRQRAKSGPESLRSLRQVQGQGERRLEWFCHDD